MPLLLEGLGLPRKEFEEGCHWFSCSESLGFVFCSHTWFCSPRSEDAILLRKQWPLVSEDPHRSCQGGLGSAQLELSRRMSWIIQIRAWEQMRFGKWPFCPPHKNLMFTMWGGKGIGILGIPGMQPPSKRNFLGCTLRDSLSKFCSMARICKDKGGKTKPKG